MLLVVRALPHKRQWWCASVTELHAELGSRAAGLVRSALGGAGAAAKYARIGRSHAMLGDRAAVGARTCTWRNARLAWHYTDLGQRAANLAVAACVGVLCAGCLGWEKALLCVWAAVLISSAMARWGRGGGARWGGTRGRWFRQIVEVESHLYRPKSVCDGAVIYGISKGLARRIVVGFGQVLLKEMVEFVFFGIHAAFATMLRPEETLRDAPVFFFPRLGTSSLATRWCV